MLLKPTEIEYVELQEDEVEEDNQDTVAEGESPYVTGKTILLGGNAEPIFIENEFSFLISNQEMDEEEEFVLSSESVILGGSGASVYEDETSEYSDLDTGSDLYSEPTYDEESNFSYDLDSDFEVEEQGPVYEGAPEFEASELDFDAESIIDVSGLSDSQKSQRSTLITKVDTKLLGKIREYRESVHEMSKEKLSSLSSGEERNRLLMEAANFMDDEPGVNADEVGQIISELDKKISGMVSKYIEIQKQALIDTREEMLKEVETDVETIIAEQIETIKSESEEHIEETVQYYRKKIESDNQLLSAANNIIARREQILDEAYTKSLSIIEESEENARTIIEDSSRAHEEAELIIAEYEQKGQEVRDEAQVESERIVADANLESGRIIQAAEDQHQDIVDAATQDGFSVGYQEGKEEALKENAELLTEALKALNKLYAAFPIAVKQNEEKIVRLSYQISESILTEPVAHRDDLNKRVVERGIRTIGDLENVKIKVNPQDLDLILPKQEYFKLVIPEVSEFVIVGDMNIIKGNCSIVAKSQELDVSINSQLSILEAVFNHAVEESEAMSAA